MREAWTDDRLDDLNRKVDDGFLQVDKRFERLEDKFDRKFDSLQRTLILGYGGIVVALVGAVATQG